MSPQLSIIVAGIQTDRWLNCWGSIDKAFAGDWELIFVGPHACPQEVLEKGNVRCIEDYGAPARCMQRGLLAARGDWVMFTWDNGELVKNSIDEIFAMLEAHNMDKNVAISGKYIEGLLPISQTYMASDIYYQINHHAGAGSPFIPDSYILFNIGVVARETILRFGGLDCAFEAPSMAIVDLAVRMQKGGVNIILKPEVILHEDWAPATEGNHGPIHFAMVEHDMPLYAVIWGVNKLDPKTIENAKVVYKAEFDEYMSRSREDRLLVDLNNWEKSPAKWERRFGKNG